jgi:UDP-glucuronate decarboxylase
MILAKVRQFQVIFMMEKNKAKIVAVFGGAGFIGSHLCERLLETGCNVICVDNFSSSGQNNISHLLRLPNFEFIRHDITEPIDFEAIEDLHKFQVNVFGISEVYNLAVPTSIKNFEKFKMQTCLANFLGTKNTLDLAVKYKAKYMQFSSQVVYGNFEKGDYVEENFVEGINNQLDPRACYDEGKRYAETLVDVYRETHNLDTKILRIFRTYGPRMLLDDGQMIPDFIVNALDAKTLMIHGDESFRTSLVYVSDVVEAALKLIDTDSHGPFNVGNPEIHQIINVAKKVVEMTGSASTIEYGEKLLFLREGAFPNISKIKDEIGWFPLVTLEEGLQKTIEYTQAHKDLLVFSQDV